MSDRNFNRQYRLKAGISHKQAFEIGKPNTSDNAALHINFSIEKSESETPNTGSVTIWNLTKAQLAILGQKDCEIELMAGYGNKLAKIITGNVTYISTYSDGGDTATDIEFSENRVALRDTYITLSYSGRISSRVILDSIANSIGVAVAVSKSAVFPYVSNGFAFVGAAQTALNKLCGICGLKWSIQNGVLQIFAYNEAISTKAYLISEDTGLINVPQKISFAASDGSELHGWEITYLMNGAIGINDCVAVESDTLSGVFRVMKILFSGDNLSGDWICTAQIVEA